MSGEPRRQLSPWWQMISGMRAYGVAITVVWAMCACTVLLVLAASIGGPWTHVVFATAAVLELLLSIVTLRFLARASVRGRFDYVSVNTPERQAIERFSVLVLSEDRGALIREVAPPQR